MVEVVSAFSIPVYAGDVTVTAADTEYCSSLPTSGDYFHEFRSSVADQILEDAALQGMKDQVLEHINVFTRDVMGIDQDRFQFEVTTSWYSAMTDSSHVVSHRHTNSVFTGFVTLECSPGTVFTMTMDNPPAVPGVFALSYNKETPYNTQRHHVVLRPHKVYILPSHISHTAKCHLPDGQLSVIIFDTFITRVRGRPPVGTGLAPGDLVV